MAAKGFHKCDKRGKVTIKMISFLLEVTLKVTVYSVNVLIKGIHSMLGYESAEQRQKRILENVERKQQLIMLEFEDLKYLLLSNSKNQSTTTTMTTTTPTITNKELINYVEN